VAGSKLREVECGREGRILTVTSEDDIGFAAVVLARGRGEPCGDDEVVDAVAVDVANAIDDMARLVARVQSVQHEAQAAVATRATPQPG
jgi:hypothetical protein